MSFSRASQKEFIVYLCIAKIMVFSIPVGFFIPGLPKLFACCDMHSRGRERLLPKLDRHFKKHNIDPSHYCTPWFFKLFLECVSFICNFVCIVIKTLLWTRLSYLCKLLFTCMCAVVCFIADQCFFNFAVVHTLLLDIWHFSNTFCKVALLEILLAKRNTLLFSLCKYHEAQ